MTDLPPLPPPGFVLEEPPSFYKDIWKKHAHYTTDQMKEYGAACAAAEREACATLCELLADEADERRPLDGSVGEALRAAAIRARGEA